MAQLTITWAFFYRYIAVTHDAHIQVWRTPNHLVRDFAPFHLHRTYTSHHDEVISIEWSPDSTFVLLSVSVGSY
jgi:WD40 repeat protein